MYVSVCNQSSGSSSAVYHHEARRLKIRVSKKEENINSGRWSGREVVGGAIYVQAWSLLHTLYFLP